MITLAEISGDPRSYDGDYFQFLALTVTSVTTLLGTALTVWAGILSKRQEKSIKNAESLIQERDRLRKIADIYQNALTLIRGNLGTITHYQEDDSRESRVMRSIDETIVLALQKGDQLMDQQDPK